MHQTTPVFYGTLLHPLLEDFQKEHPVFCNPDTLRLSNGAESSGLEVIVASIYGLGMCLLAPQCVVQGGLSTKPALIGTSYLCLPILLHVTHGRLLFAGFSWLEMIVKCDADVVSLTGGFDGSHVPVDCIR